MSTTRRDFIAGVVAAAAMPATAGATAPAWPYDASGGLADAIDRAMRHHAELMAQNQPRLHNLSNASAHWALFEKWGDEYVEMCPAKLGDLLQWLDVAAQSNWLYEKIARESYGDWWLEPMGAVDRERLLDEVARAGEPTVFYFEHRKTGERVPLTGKWLYEFYNKYKEEYESNPADIG